MERLIAGRYEVVEELARGGMGVVYLGWQTGLDRQVAIKVVRGDLRDSPRLLARFKREAAITTKLTHPNTVRIYDVGETAGGDAFIVMEYLAGHPLSRVLQRHGPLPHDAVVHIGRQVCRSLVEAHAKGIVHRDIKPSNLMWCDQLGAALHVKVLDFGVARLRGDSLGVETASGAFVGTHFYASPEQTLGRPVDARTDLYSLGVTLLELATAQRPFEGRSPIEAAIQIASPEPVRLPPDVTERPLGRVIARALCKNPDDRYADAAEMLDALEAIDVDIRALSDVLAETVALSGRRLHSRATLVEDDALSLRATAEEAFAPPDLSTPTEGYTAPESAEPLDLARREQPELPPDSKLPTAKARLSWLPLVAVATVGAILAFAVSRASRDDAAPAESAASVTLTERQVTSLPIDVQLTNGLHPALSRDGRAITYVDSEGAWLQPVDGGQRRPLDLPDDRYVSDFLPDGRLLICCRATADVCPLELLDPDTGETWHLGDSAGRSVVSPDGGRIASFTGNGISVIAIDGGDRRQLVPVQFMHLTSLRWSPDGRFLAYSFYDPAGVHVVDAESGATRVVLQDDSLRVDVLGPTTGWLDDQHLLFTALPESIDGTGTELWQARVTPTTIDDLRRLHVWPTATIVLQSNVRAGTLAVSRWETQRDVFVAALAWHDDRPSLLGEPHRLTLSDRQDLTGPWLDDRRITFASSRSGNWDIYVQDRDAGGAQLLVAGTSYDVPVEALPDGSLLFWRSPPHEAESLWCDLMRWSSESDEVERVVRIAEGQSCLPRSYPRGGYPFHLECVASRCLLSEPTGDGYQFSELALEDGDRVRLFDLASAEILTWSISPDGEQLWAALGNDDEMHLLSARSGEVLWSGRLVPPQLVMDPQFGARGDRFWLSGYSVEHDAYALSTADNGGHAAPFYHAPNRFLGHPSPAPGDDFLAYTVVAFDEDVWVVEGF